MHNKICVYFQKSLCQTETVSVVLPTLYLEFKGVLFHDQDMLMTVVVQMRKTPLLSSTNNDKCKSKKKNMDLSLISVSENIFLLGSDCTSLNMQTHFALNSLLNEYIL